MVLHYIISYSFSLFSRMFWAHFLGHLTIADLKGVSNHSNTGHLSTVNCGSSFPIQTEISLVLYQYPLSNGASCWLSCYENLTFPCSATYPLDLVPSGGRGEGSHPILLGAQLLSPERRVPTFPVRWPPDPTAAGPRQLWGQAGRERMKRRRKRTAISPRTGNARVPFLLLGGQRGEKEELS